MIWLESLIILACIMIGARKNGVAMGFAGGVGLCLLVFIFGLRPSSPPVNVLLIITAVSAMAATLQCAGGLDLLVAVAEKILRSHPDRITIMAPIVTFVFTMFTGTSYVAMAVYPVISEVALEANIRVERPMSIAMVASQHGISASPVSASTAALLGVLAVHGVTLGQIMAVAIPAIFVGCMLGALSVYRRGCELADDPEFQRRLASGELTHEANRPVYVPTREAKLSVTIFGIAVFLIVLLGSFKSLMPSWQVNGKLVTLSIPHAIEMIAFAASFIMVVTCNVAPGKIAKSGVFTAGMTGVIAIFGIVLFGMSALLLSQGATTSSLMPIGASLGLPVSALVAMAPAVNGLFFFPATGSAISALTFDRSGTTRIGKWVLNHSYQRPGFVTCISSVVIGFVLASVVF